MKTLLRAMALSALLCLPVTAQAPPARGLDMCVLFPGVVADKDFNQLGYEAMLHARDKLGVKTDFIQRVDPAQASRIMRERIDSGANVIWGHGGQFLASILEICVAKPDIAFIAEAEEPPATGCSNVHVIGRELHKGFYVLGALAARMTKTGQIGFIGGMRQGFSRAQVNAALSALGKYNPGAKLRHVSIGDFNDPMHSRQAAEEFIEEGCDIILSGVNMGNFGIIEAVNAAEAPVFFTTLYTSKREFSPSRFLTSDMFDFTGPLAGVLQAIREGRPGGFTPMPWGKGKARYPLFPIDNVPPAVNKEMEDLARDIETGTVQVPLDQDTVPSNP